MEPIRDAGPGDLDISAGDDQMNCGLTIWSVCWGRRLRDVRHIAGDIIMGSVEESNGEL